MSSAFFLTHEDDTQEIIYETGEALLKFLKATREEEQATLKWSS